MDLMSLFALIHVDLTRFGFLDLMEIIDTMMQKEIENVRRQKTIARAKLDLYNNLSSEYDEQMRLIKEQVSINTI